MTENLQFKSQGKPSTSSSLSKKRQKKTLRKPNEKFTCNKGSSTLCNRCKGKPLSNKSCPVLNKKSRGTLLKCADVNPGLNQLNLAYTKLRGRREASWSIVVRNGDGDVRYRCPLYSNLFIRLLNFSYMGTIRRLKAYDGHQLTLLGSLTCDVE